MIEVEIVCASEAISEPKGCPSRIARGIYIKMKIVKILELKEGTKMMITLTLMTKDKLELAIRVL